MYQRLFHILGAPIQIFVNCTVYIYTFSLSHTCPQHNNFSQSLELVSPGDSKKIDNIFLADISYVSSFLKILCEVW